MADTWFSWSATDSANTSVDGTNVNTGMSPANVDNAFRKIMAACRNSVGSALQTFIAGTTTLPIVNGGTAAADVATALSNLGALADDYRDLVRVDKAASFTFANSERGGGIVFNDPAPATATINPNATTAINDGAVYVIFNTGIASLTIARGSGVLLFANGSASSADAVLAPAGVATIIKWGTDYWTINGAGVS